MRVLKAVLAALLLFAMVSLMRPAIALWDGYLHSDAGSINAAFAERYYLRGRPIVERWEAMNVFERGYYFSAFQSFPDLSNCMASSSDDGAIGAFNWKAPKTSAQLEVCLFHVSQKLNSPESMASWLENEGVKTYKFPHQWQNANFSGRHYLIDGYLRYDSCLALVGRFSAISDWAFFCVTPISWGLRNLSLRVSDFNTEIKYDYIQNEYHKDVLRIQISVRYGGDVK
ncbi:hypothetical protein E2A64_09715 [Pseudohoeflea suaedae]|uniref:Uncharacterized protein n=1 Tax=Pseudohoeflea suaedae TaxID=877384 RepID=A0A4R5PQA5_9HYPH|nr:hypothetical protein [Pseudohoeflea suaedae]TDH39314.1 hypothetical protein E2A64_09715 [Pseudohoeflea suaedae]